MIISLKLETIFFEKNNFFKISFFLLQKINKVSIFGFLKNAGVAQLVEQLICNQLVGGSSPLTSSKKARFCNEIGLFAFKDFS